MTYPDQVIISHFFSEIFPTIQKYDYRITLGQYKARYKIISQTKGQRYKIARLCICFDGLEKHVYEEIPSTCCRDSKDLRLLDVGCCTSPWKAPYASPIP